MLAVLLVALAIGAEAAKAYCSPQNATCWPTEEAWQQFNSTIEGTLIRGALSSTTSTDAMVRVEDPWAMQCINWQMETPPPEFAVAATSQTHVSMAVRFAAKHQLRLVIKSTGHDYAGRSTTSGALMIWMHKFPKDVDILSAFDDGCDGQGAPPAVMVKGGTQWWNVVPKVSAAGYQVVSGNALSVSAVGGFILGGGHSVVSPSYGMGADNVLEFTVVTADGEVRTANQCTNEDLFWALRGGGGGTFGVLLSATYKLYEAPASVNGLDVIVPLADSKGFMEKYISLVPTLDSRWGGYLLTQYFPFIGSMLLHIVFNGPASEAESTISELKGWYDKHKPKGSYWGMNSYDSFFDWHGNTTDLTGSGVSMTSRLVPASNMTETLADDIYDFAQKDGATMYMVLMGGAVNTADPTSTRTSVNSHIRSAAMHVVAVSAWEQGTDQSTIAARKAQTSEFGAKLKTLVPGTGSYFNEMQYDEANWQDSFFGDNYARLLDIKKTVDPSDPPVFTCHHCVGSEAYVTLDDPAASHYEPPREERRVGTDATAGRMGSVLSARGALADLARALDREAGVVDLALLQPGTSPESLPKPMLV